VNTLSDTSSPVAPAATAAPALAETDLPRQTTPFLVLQFFIFPMAVVAVCVAVFLVFGLVASGPKDPRAILAEVRTGGGLFNIKRWQAAYALANALEAEADLSRARRDPRFVEDVVALFEETAGGAGDDLLVRRYLAVALGRLGNPRAVGALRGVLHAQHETDAQTVIYSAWALGAIADPAALPELLDLAHSGDAGLRKTAVHALGSFSAPEAQTALAAALADDVRDVRWNAALALARHRDRRAAPILLEMLDRDRLATVNELTDEQREDALREAVKAAGALGDPELHAALTRLRASDPSLQVREAARVALEGGRS
jgi:hypothetical protein